MTGPSGRTVHVDRCQGSPSEGQDGSSPFDTTHWSLVLAAGSADSDESKVALENLCRAYWYPVYAFIRRRGYEHADAEDLTQGFFERLLAHESIRAADPARGRFRAFLLTAAKNHLANHWDHAHAAKRGGNRPRLSFDELGARDRFMAELGSQEPPDLLFDRHWAIAVLERVKARLQLELARPGSNDPWTWLEPLLAGERSEATYAQLAARQGLTTASVKAKVHRARTRFRTLLRHEIAHTVRSPDEIDDEIRQLRDALIR